VPKSLLVLGSLVALTGSLSAAAATSPPRSAAEDFATFSPIASLSSVRTSRAAENESPSDLAGQFVFESDRTGDSDIYAVNPDGTGLTPLTINTTGDYAPIPSPDGKYIVFETDGDPAIMSGEGGARRSLSGCSTVREGAWSPDSTRLLCEVGYSEGFAVVDAATGTLTRLNRSGSYGSWSPDGVTVAFIDGERLWVVPAAGGARRRLGNRKIDEGSVPSWSPDSQRISYIGAAGLRYRQDLFTIGVDGSGERRIVPGVNDFSTPAWSPEGSLIAFEKGLPQDIIGVFTVRPDGTDLTRVSVSPGRESSGNPAWSADGGTLVYLRWRYRFGGGTDVFVTTPGAGPGHAVTRPFPAGGANVSPRWAPGPPLSGVEPTPETVTLPPTHRLTFTSPLEELTTDGRHAIPSYDDLGSSQSSNRVLVWDGVAGSVRRTPALCTTNGIVLAGVRLAWTCIDSGNTYIDIQLKTLRLGAGRPTFVTESFADEEGAGMTIGSLVGHGSTIAFTTYHGTRRQPKAWVLLARHGRKCPLNSDLLGAGRPLAVCRRLKGAGGGVTASVDAGRVLTVGKNGLVRIHSTRGRVLRTWRLARGIDNARLRGRALAVQHRLTLDVYDTATGALRQSLPLSPDGGGRSLLLDVQGDLVVYATGGAIHLLRLSDGRDRALDLPGAAPSLDARLERHGLFVSWNQMYSRRPGRMAFVPMGAVIRGFGAS
jgi:TolB protein